MAWSTSDRRESLPANWPQLRAEVLARAGGRCEARNRDGRRCWDRKANQVDHVRPHAEGGTDDLSNLQLLCEWHHNRKSSAEGGRSYQQNMAKLRASIRREPETHKLIPKSEAVPRARKGF